MVLPVNGSNTRSVAKSGVVVVGRRTGWIEEEEEEKAEETGNRENPPVVSAACGASVIMGTEEKVMAPAICVGISIHQPARQICPAAH